MLVQDTFQKDIFRAIDPVVRADEDKYLANELDEFVITNEVERHLLEFFEEYNEPNAVGNGAWISGFFGSGKSHLLKILAVVLEDRKVDGKFAMDYILPKVAHNSSLRSAMEVARRRHPSESVLFDIDHIAPNEGRSESGALLAAFIRAFSMHCGYFDGDQQHIAQLEWDLYRIGKLQDFEEAVQRRCKMPWRQARVIAPAKARDISAAYDEVCGNPEGTYPNIVDYYRQTYSPSIRSFAERVRDYIQMRKLGFRLNFFVDEVGLFIARNSKLMVNLQSVAEELNTICGGASWIVVTSQEAMEGIVTGMTDASGEDFTKIQARFDLKMPLTSQDAKTVIRDRLLAKSTDSEPEYLRIYEERKADFGVLFDFADGAKRYGQYRDFDDFLATYPFVPYQFDVFMTAMRELSRKDAFTGKHNSTGARSMLGVFQDVAQELCRDGASTENEQLASFDLMFEGLRNSFRTEFYASVSQAEHSSTLSPTCVRVLKALLLVKYCRDFRATPGNVRVLLYGSFNERPAKLENDIRSALDELENQLYVRRNGNEYEYLTDDEKEVESEIRNTPVSDSDNRKLIAKLFQDVVGNTRVTYENDSFEHVYKLNLRVDGELQGPQRNDLTLDLVTDYSACGQFDQATPTPPKTLTVRLVDSRTFLAGVRTHLQTDRYTKKASGQGEVREAIIADKRQANYKLYGQLREQLREFLTHATFNAGGADVTDCVTGSGKDAVASAALELVRRSYPMLQQISTTITDRQVGQEAIAMQMGAMLPEYCETVLARIGLLSSAGTVTVDGDGMGSLTSVFTKGDFGWPEVVVRSAVARLFAANQVEVKRAGKELQAGELATVLQKRQDLDKLVVEKVSAVTPEELSTLKAAIRPLMGNTLTSDDPKALAEELRLFADSQAKAYRSNLSATRQYPFSDRFAQRLAQLETLASKAEDWHWVVTAFPGVVPAPAEVREDLQKMATFANGSPMQKRYEDLRAFDRDESAEALALGVASEDVDEIRATLADEQCYATNRVVLANKLMADARKAMVTALTEVRSTARSRIEGLRDSYASTYDLASLPNEDRASFDAIFDAYLRRAESARTKREVEALPGELQSCEAARILAIVALKPVVENPSDEPVVGDDGDFLRTAPKPKTVSARSLVPRGWSKPVLATHGDAAAYAEEIRHRIEVAIDNGDIVTC